MIKAILFDYDQTLVDSAEGFRRAEKQAQKQIFEDIQATSWDNFLSVYRPLRKQFHRASNISRKALWEEVYHQHGKPYDSSMLEKWEDEYWLTVKAQTILFPETLSTLESLSRRHTLAAITNTQAQAGEQKHRLIETPQLTVCFQTVIVAGEEGISPKPDCSAFLACLDDLRLDPDQAVYVGDDWHTDICGAADVGIQPIWIQHRLLSRNWPEPDREISVPVITSLDSLLEIDRIISEV